MVRENERAHEFEATFGEYVCDGYAFQLTFFLLLSLRFSLCCNCNRSCNILLKENIIYIYELFDLINICIRENKMQA